jgi:hypothetical protein
MKSARRKALAAKKRKEAKGTFPLLKLLIPIVLIIVVFVMVKLTTHTWDGKNKIAVAYKSNDSSVGVIVIDPALSEITNIVIPGDTQIDVAENYGTMLIKNVWQLGFNEKIKGRLLPETITQNFLFPVYLWSDSNASGLGEGNVNKIIKFMFIPGLTNVSFGDRLAMGFFAMKTQSFGRTTIDMGKSHFLDKTKLEDGSSGYIISGPVSQRLTMYFSDNEFGSQSLKVNIVDATGSLGVSEKVGEILQVIGGKVVSVEKRATPEDSDCTLYGTNREIVDRVSNLFSCEKGVGKSNFDLDIHLGSYFAERF